ncbi:MAG: hypothetical protein ACK544_07095, partial [Microcystis sp.]
EYEMLVRLVGSEMCIRDRKMGKTPHPTPHTPTPTEKLFQQTLFILPTSPHPTLMHLLHDINA